MRIGVLIALILAAPVDAKARCVPFDTLTTPALFARFSAPHAPRQHWHAPIVASGEARTFRTVVRQAASGVPDFAGHWTVARIDCGAATVCPAFVDRLSGRVRFVHALRDVFSLQFDPATSAALPRTLTYRSDSRLLVILGSINDNEARAGAHLFVWSDGRLARIRFVPEDNLCRGVKA
jgi:hypothetical protein